MKVALLQICSKLDFQKNLEKIRLMIDQVSKEAPDTDAIILPEVFYSMSDGTKPTPHLVEEGNNHLDNITSLSKKSGMALLGGSAATRVDGKIYNRSYNLDEMGNVLSLYDKIHLFKLDLEASKKKMLIDEGRTYSAGKNLKSFRYKNLHFGVTICFDLRFPELFREYFSLGCDAFLVSSAFTMATGKAHWETLLRSRAIENQSYVIACNQWGKHNEKLTSFGHSMVIDPWGDIIVNAGEGEKIVYANLDKEKVETVRRRMKMQKQLST